MKSAMTYGFTLGIYWVVKYLFLALSARMPALGVIYFILTLAVPVVAYMLTKRYRADVGGSVSFFHAWQFGVLLYFFAALIVSVVHFAYFQYWAPKDFLTHATSQLADLLRRSEVDKQVVDAVGQMSLSPIRMAIQGIFNNVFYGVVLSIPVAALLCGNNRTGTIGDPSGKRPDA